MSQTLNLKIVGETEDSRLVFEEEVDNSGITVPKKSEQF